MQQNQCNIKGSLKIKTKKEFVIQLNCNEIESKGISYDYTT